MLVNPLQQQRAAFHRRFAYPKLVDFEVLPVSIRQRAANDAAVCVASKYAQQPEISNCEAGVVGTELRCHE